ncbi:MAG: aldo/keto reductase [Deltaproteobacteria bacterium]|nr:aldo/keto reductase [Deltaproteobacteria bacterium]
MIYKELGPTGVKVSAIGLGGMPMSLKGRPREEQSIRVIHRALDLGVTLIDTADSYCQDESDKHHNERLIAKALKSRGAASSAPTQEIIVATKGGLMRPGGDWVTNGDPKHIARTIRESFEALGGERPIALWQLHAPDDRYLIEETLRPVKEAVDEGLIRFVGLSNVSVEEIRRARKIVDIVSIQNRYNPWCRDPEKDGVLAYCEKEKLTFLPWSPLGGSYRVGQIGQIPVFQEISQKRTVSPYQVVLAWLMAKSPCVVPIPGASRVESIEDSVKAAEMTLSVEEIRQIDKAIT